MNRLLIIITLLLSATTSVVLSQSMDDLNSIRNDLFYSEFDLEKGQAFYDKIVNLAGSEQSAVLKAYKASAKALIAKFSWNPINKIGHLKCAMSLLDEAVSSDMSNIEIRFLRFYIQNHVPAFLGYSTNMEEDKIAIVENLHKLSGIDLSKDVQTYISDYMSNFGISAHLLATPND